MKKIKVISQKGITMVSLIVTIVVLLILSTIIITDTYTGADYKRYKLMCADIELLEDKVLIYYDKYGEIPKRELTSAPEGIENGHEFYKLDTTKLNNLTLNYSADDDIFIIDATTFEVYYQNGIEYNGATYYTD